MDEVCSLQLLTSVRRMVLTLTQQNDESKMFVRFFHKQLGGILQVCSNTRFFAFVIDRFQWFKPLPLFPCPSRWLQDSLGKFVGRTLKDCGEDLLVEISEILFNELAFFRLMQELDSSSGLGSAAKHRSKKTNELTEQGNQSPKVSLVLHFTLISKFQPYGL